MSAFSFIILTKKYSFPGVNFTFLTYKALKALIMSQIFTCARILINLITKKPEIF